MECDGLPSLSCLGARAAARIGSGASPNKKGTKNLKDSSFLIIVFLCYEKNDP